MANRLRKPWFPTHGKTGSGVSTGLSAEGKAGEAAAARRGNARGGAPRDVSDCSENKKRGGPCGPPLFFFPAFLSGRETFRDHPREKRIRIHFRDAVHEVDMQRAVGMHNEGRAGDGFVTAADGGEKLIARAEIHAADNRAVFVHGFRSGRRVEPIHDVLELLRYAPDAW